MRRYAALLAASTVLGCSPPPDEALTPDEAADCEECAITLERVVTLGTPQDTIGPTLFSYIARTSNGSFVVSTSDHPGAQLVYDSTGKIATHFGRAGGGPGEYGFLTMPLIGPGDTVSIFDFSTLRRTVVDSSGAPIRDHIVPAGTRALDWYGSRLIGTTRAQSGTISLVALDPVNGAPGDSIAIAPRVPSAGGIASAVLVPLADGSLLVAHSSALGFTRVDSSFRKIGEMELSTDWFPPNDGGTGNPLADKPESRLLAGWESADGLIWIVAMTADLKWAPAPQEQERPVRLSDGIQMYDWIIAAFDPKTRAERAHLRFDGPLIKDLNGETLYAPRELPDGRIVLDGWRAQLGN